MSFSSVNGFRNFQLPPGLAVRQQYFSPTGNQPAPVYSQGAGNNAYTPAYQVNPQAVMSTLMGLLSLLFSQFMGKPNDTPSDQTGQYEYNNPPAPPPAYPPAPQPPVYQEPEKLKGSAGLFGDPQFGLFTPGVKNAPNALKAFDSGIKNGQTVTLLKDSNLGGLEVNGTGVQVDPNRTNSTGIGSATFKSGNDTVKIQGDGSLLVNGQNRGKIGDKGFIAPIKLANGLTVSTENAIDGANGKTAERFVIRNGEYKITAAARNPHPDSAAYLDMNFEELTANAADNATGFQANVAGLARKFGIADLLRLEPDSFT